METISFKSPVKIERLLDQLIADVNTNQDDEITVSDLLYEDYEDTNRYEGLIKAIFQNRYVNEHYDGDTVVELLHYAFYKSSPKTGGEFLKAFIDIFANVKNDWIAIFPLDHSGVLASLTRSRRFPITRLGAFLIVPSFRKKQNLVRFFETEFGVTSIDGDLLEHQALLTGNFILTNPLLVFPLHGSRPVGERNAKQNFRVFRQLHNLYTANYGARQTLRTVHHHQNPVRHLLLLDRKWGELYRCPAPEGTLLLTRLEPSTTRKSIRNGFSELLSLLTKNSASSQLTDRMLRALHFFSKGFNEQDQLSRFLFYVISAEALFSKDRDTPITATLADYVSLLTSNGEERLLLHKRVREIYGLRSSIVHSGKSNVSEEALVATETFVAQTLLRSLKCLLPPNSMKKDDEFFQQLTRLKLRLRAKL